MAEIIEGVHFERAPGGVMMRITGVDNEPITIATIDAIEYEVWKIPVPIDARQGKWESAYIDTAQPEKVNTDPSPMVLEPADVIFDELVTDDANWTQDAVGYNFLAAIPASCFPLIALADYPKSQWMRVDFKFTPFAGGAFPRSVILEVKAVLGGR